MSFSLLRICLLYISIYLSIYFFHEWLLYIFTYKYTYIYHTSSFVVVVSFLCFLFLSDRKPNVKLYWGTLFLFCSFLTLYLHCTKEKQKQKPLDKKHRSPRTSSQALFILRFSLIRFKRRHCVASQRPFQRSPTWRVECL